MKIVVCIILVLCFMPLYLVQASFSDYISSVGKYFGYRNENDEGAEEFYNQKIPYEVTATDEKFLNEAAKLTGIALSELDSCQQRVVLKLQSDCARMNDEQLAKMAVHLLNCQSFVEGRQIFPCTDEMSIKDCTTSMDSDTWTSYHLMSNRARAVCYSIRQSQFRGLAEYTVNRLMDAAKDQLRTLGRIANNQENLKNLAATTYETLNKGHEHLSKQQKDIESAQFHGQLALEDNIRRLTDEKRLISDTHKQLIEMTQNMQNKLGYSLKQLDHHGQESKLNHKELIDDVLNIQEKVQEIFKKIEQSSSLLLKQNEDFKKQYGSTLRNLQEVNETVHNLVTLVGGTRKALEEHMTWITTALGGTDLAVERLYLILWHSTFMLITMLACSFLAGRASTRLAVVALPSLNLAVALYGKYPYLDPISLTCALGGFIIIQTILLFAASLSFGPKDAIQWINENNTVNKEATTNLQKEFVSSTNIHPVAEVPLSHRFDFDCPKPINDEDETNYTNEVTNNFKEDYHSLTPPLSRNSHYSVRSRSRSNTPLHLNTSLKSSCHAKTRMGTPCKLSSLPGRDYCYRHQKGDSVMG